MANEAERARWTNDQMVANWPKRERFTDRVVPHVVAALRPAAGEKVLDIGAGGGKLSLAVGELVGAKGKVTGADISEGMVHLASGRAQEAKARNVNFVAADVQGEKVPGAPFDAACSQFGVMFFDEPLTAFTNIRKQLKKGGRLAFACWQPMERNTWFVGPIIAPFAVPPPPPAPGKSPTGPFALGNARSTRAVLANAGFTGITRTPKKLVVWVPSDSVADAAMVGGFGVPEAKRDAAVAALEKHFDKFRRPDGLCRFELNIQLFTATNPA